ncbi:hypothetical protein [Nocardioides albus]|uniref:Uncharacterized protein n=1 Tax=Nocardioides albus TaxID=1841 RepID=A0A7W5A9E8_9ACTN|nr:hypothetical protein [Nocardioides albus]MBB3092146.1 hypothetical protein [Nocardioides albus]
MLFGAFGVCARVPEQESRVPVTLTRRPVHVAGEEPAGGLCEEVDLESLVDSRDLSDLGDRGVPVNVIIGHPQGRAVQGSANDSVTVTTATPRHGIA